MRQIELMEYQLQQLWQNIQKLNKQEAEKQRLLKEYREKHENLKKTMIQYGLK